MLWTLNARAHDRPIKREAGEHTKIMLIDLPQDIWPHVWVKSANMFGEVEAVYDDNCALIHFDEILQHQVKPPSGYSYATEVDILDVYRFHPTLQ